MNLNNQLSPDLEEEKLVITDEQLCDRCGENQGKDMHSCPYDREMQGNGECVEQCNCCEDCEDVCRGDI